jgi:ankyrin repeat protein
MYLLHKAISGGSSTYVVKLLLEAFPTSCAAKDEKGMVPLHHACAITTVDSIDIIILMLKSCPTSSTMLDNKGTPPIPSFYFTQFASQDDKCGMLLLHRQVAYPNDININFLRFLVKVYPASVSSPYNYDMLPFHRACLNEASSTEALMYLLQ